MSTSNTERSTLRQLSEEVAGIAEIAGRSVVGIHARPRTPSSGVHWRPGIIVTASHTLKQEESIRVTLPDGRDLSATLAGRDRGTDLAVLKAEISGLPPVEVGDASQVRAGHIVVALGRREAGESGPRVGLGWIRALGGAWQTWRGARIDQWVRVDVPIFMGFSGGPLLSAGGQVLGINTTGLVRGAALTLPATTIARAVAEILEKGYVTKGYIGLGLQPVRLPESLREKQSLRNQSGLLVVSVEPEGPAEKSGAMLGDVLTAVGGKPLENLESLQAALVGERAGSQLKFTVIRAGSPIELSITAGEQPR